MTPTLQKELRTLAFPAGVALAAILAGVWASSGRDVMVGTRMLLMRASMIAFFLGTPLLPSLPFGSEFQHKTIVLLLSAPVSRGRIWLEKWLAATTVVVVLTAIVLAVLVLRWPDGEWPVVPALMFIFMAACAAPFWTLVARSTIGGLTFTLSTIMMIELAGSYLTYRFKAALGPVQDLFGRTPALDAIRILYAAITLYAGYALFSRFQVAATGLGAASQTGAREGWSLLRARPSGAVVNFVRKELMLHRLVFVIAAVFASGWIVSTMLVVTNAVSRGFADVLPALLLAGYMPLVIVLAGTIPVGEDTSLGIREWHLTLPMSARTQWLLKLGVAVAVFAVLGLLLPGLATYVSGRLTHGRIGGAEMFRSPSFQVIVTGALLIAFWASTMFGDALRSAVATGTAVLAVGLCSMLGSRLGDWIPLRQSWWVPLTVHFQLPSFYLQAVWMWPFVFGLLVTALVAVGLPQSYAAFRRVRLDRTFRIRHCAILFGVALGTFTFASNLRISSNSQRFGPGIEIRQAVLNLPVPPEEKYGDPARTVTLEELDRVRHLSPDTWRWMSGATITLQRLQSRRSGAPSYVVRIRFPNGLKDAFFVNLGDR